MLLWINGPFGGGKTHTAHEIQRRLAGSVVCDPEHLGVGLRRMMPRQLRSNFQDIPAWRQGTRQVLDLVLGHHDGDVIVPMTVIELAYLNEILGPLRANGHQVRHYSLLAARATVLRRLRGRTLPLQRDAFAEAMLDQCLDRLSHDDFAEHVRTDELTIAQVADRIAASAGLTLTPDDDSFLRARARRTWVTIRHIRIVLPGHPVTGDTAVTVCSVMSTIWWLAATPSSAVAARSALAADYVASLASHYQDQTARPWPDVVEDVRQQAQAVIDDDGAFITSGDLAAFVCR